MFSKPNNLDVFVRQHDYPCWCGDTAARVVCQQLFGRRFVVLGCRTCGCQRILPKAIQTQADALSLYNEDRHTRAKLATEFAQKNAASILNRIQQVGIHFSEGMTVIDAGCSEGLLLEMIRQRYNCRVIGVDADEQTIAQARRNYPGVTFLCGLVHEQLHNLPLADVVIASAILEHVTDPPQFVNGLSGLLKPGGDLFILTPNAGSVHYRIARSWWRELLSIGEHIYLFNRASLDRLAARCGLEVGGFVTDYDLLQFPRWPRSFSGTLIWGWVLARYLVKAVCMALPRGQSGDILCAKLSKPALLKIQSRNQVRKASSV